MGRVMNPTTMLTFSTTESKSSFLRVIFSLFLTSLLLPQPNQMTYASKNKPNEVFKRVSHLLNRRELNKMTKDSLEELTTRVTISYETRRKGFQYVDLLHDAMSAESTRFDDLEDPSLRLWSIRAFRIDGHSKQTVNFRGCSMCGRNQQTTSKGENSSGSGSPEGSGGSGNRKPCNVSRVEFLVPLVREEDGRVEIPAGFDAMVEVAGRMVNTSRGTVPISRAAIFDLTPILLTARDAGELPAEGSDPLSVTIHANSCCPLHIRRAMLFEYCNMNHSVVDRFWGHVDGSSHRGRRHLEVDEARYRNIEDPPGSYGEEVGEEADHSQLSSLEQLNDGEMASQKNGTFTAGESESSTEGLMGVGTHRGNRTTPVSVTRKPRDSPQRAQKLHHQKGYGYHHRPGRHRHRRHRRHRRSEMPCRRVSDFVDMSHLLAAQSLVRPRGPVDIGLCSGSCKSGLLVEKLDAYMTGHSVMRNQFCRLFPRECVRDSMCTPHRMSSVSITRFTEYGFATDVLYNLRITSCRCT